MSLSFHIDGGAWLKMPREDEPTSVEILLVSYLVHEMYIHKPDRSPYPDALECLALPRWDYARHRYFHYQKQSYRPPLA